MGENKQEEVTNQEVKQEIKDVVKNKSIIPVIIVIIIFGTIAILVGIAMGTYFTKHLSNNTTEESKNKNEDEYTCENEEKYNNEYNGDIDEIITGDWSHVDVKKPIIYLYPEEESKIIVKLSRPDLLTCTYPKYRESIGWEVIATPDGTLIDEETGREYYSLYWEGKNYNKKDIEEGFVIKGENTAEFLEEKLEILGLTEKETQEFIIYWLPQMEDNKYNLIRFETIDEINKNMSLEINPTPDTIIRIMMDWKPLDEYIEIPEQELNKVERQGYTVVEWGGSKLN